MTAERRPVVVVTGASAGVGRAVAVAYGRQGARVALLARGRAGLAAAAAEVEKAGGIARVIPTDVADAEAVASAAEQAEADLGEIDVWVNNAMATIFSPLAAVTPAEFRRATDVTYLGTVWGTMAALGKMRSRNRGVIVQVGSALAYRAIPLQAPYCGAKFAIRGFTDSLRAELLSEGSAVRLAMVQLPAVNTPQFGWCRSNLDCHPRPVAPVFQPELAARAVLWAATNPCREFVLGARSVLTIWGAKFAPAATDHLLGRIGASAQQMAEDTGPRSGNLFCAADETSDATSHGRFDHEAHGYSTHLEISARLPRPSGRLLGAVLARLLG
ncbi:MAG: SDR family oxidoreductase [Acidimicrobiales bacterium]